MEHFGVQKYLRYYKLLSINYSNVSASSSSDLDLLWRRLYGDRHEILYIYMCNISVICGPNITVQCKEYDYVVTYGRNTHSHMYKNEKEKKHKKEKNI